MPLKSAFSAFGYGVLSGFLAIIWIIIGAIFLYNLTLISGKFEVVKESIIYISFDRRLQVILIAFSFGAIIEGTSGFGTPVAIAGAVMVGLGFPPFQSAVLNLLANTAPVAYGAIGTPIVMLSTVTGLDQLKLSTMVGHQLPFVSHSRPVLAGHRVRPHGGRQVERGLGGVARSAVRGRHLRPHAVVRVLDAGLPPHDRRGRGRLLRHLHRPVPALRLAPQDAVPAAIRARSPGQGRKEYGDGDSTDKSEWVYPYTFGQTAYAWLPWTILILCCAVWGIPAWKAYLNNLFAGITFKTTLLGSVFAGKLSLPQWQMPALHNLVQRVPPIAPLNAKPEGAVFSINWLIGGRDRRLRGGLVVRTCPGIECQTVGRGRAANRSSPGDPHPG